MDRIILWLAANVLSPLTKGLKKMTKESEARDALTALLTEQESTIERVKAWHEADDETDATKLQPLIEQAQRNNAQLAALTGVSTTVNPSLPIDGVTGENLPPATDGTVSDEDDEDVQPNG